MKNAKMMIQTILLTGSWNRIPSGNIITQSVDMHAIRVGQTSCEKQLFKSWPKIWRLRNVWRLFLLKLADLRRWSNTAFEKMTVADIVTTSVSSAVVIQQTHMDCDNTARQNSSGSLYHHVYGGSGSWLQQMGSALIRRCSSQLSRNAATARILVNRSPKYKNLLILMNCSSFLCT